MDYAMQSSGWLMLDAVENLFKYAKERVYTEKNGNYNLKSICTLFICIRISVCACVRKYLYNVTMLFIYVHNNEIYYSNQN